MTKQNAAFLDQKKCIKKIKNKLYSVDERLSNKSCKISNVYDDSKSVLSEVHRQSRKREKAFQVSGSIPFVSELYRVY